MTELTSKVNGAGLADSPSTDGLPDGRPDKAPHHMSYGSFSELIPRSYTVYPSRYYILLTYSLILCFQCFTWNTFGPISESLEFAYGWDEATIATLVNWGPICYVIAAIPSSYALYKFGLRSLVVTSTGLVLVGHGLRCINSDPTTFKIMANICAVVNGCQCTLLSASTLVSAVWFPASQRITATAVSAVLNQLGGGLSFLETLVVRQPSNKTAIDDVRADIRHLMYFDLGLAAVFFLCAVVYFPSAPPTPPSSSSEVERYDFKKGFREIAITVKFWQLLIPYAMFTGVSMVWMGVINFSLEQFGLSQEEIGWLGFYNGLVVVTICLAASRLADVFYGHLKVALLSLMAISSAFYVWFMLLSLEVITATKGQVYLTVLGGQAFNFATTPFFFELCVETVYPSPEFGVGTIASLANSLVACLFLFLFYIPALGDDSDPDWMTYLLVATNILPIIPVIFFKEEYKRSRLDRGQ